MANFNNLIDLLGTSSTTSITTLDKPVSLDNLNLSLNQASQAEQVQA